MHHNNRHIGTPSNYGMDGMSLKVGNQLSLSDDDETPPATVVVASRKGVGYY